MNDTVGDVADIARRGIPVSKSEPIIWTRVGYRAPHGLESRAIPHLPLEQKPDHDDAESERASQIQILRLGVHGIVCVLQICPSYIVRQPKPFIPEPRKEAGHCVAERTGLYSSSVSASEPVVDGQLYRRDVFSMSFSREMRRPAACDVDTLTSSLPEQQRCGQW